MGLKLTLLVHDFAGIDTAILSGLAFHDGVNDVVVLAVILLITVELADLPGLGQVAGASDNQQKDQYYGNSLGKRLVHKYLLLWKFLGIIISKFGRYLVAFF